MRTVLQAVGADWLQSNPLDPKLNAKFQERCAESLRHLEPFLPRVRTYAAEPLDQGAAQGTALLAVLEGLDRTLAEARPFLEKPAARIKRRRGDLHLDLIWALDAILVIAFRLVRGGASPVMPVQRWIGHETPFEIWQRTHTRQPNLFFRASTPDRTLRFFTRQITLLTPADIKPLLTIAWRNLSLSPRAMYEATLAYNRQQADRGEAQLFTFWPEDANELQEYIRRFEADQTVYQRVLAAVTEDLQTLHAGGFVYAAWTASYDHA